MSWSQILRRNWVSINIYSPTWTKPKYSSKVSRRVGEGGVADMEVGWYRVNQAFWFLLARLNYVICCQKQMLPSQIQTNKGRKEKHLRRKYPRIPENSMIQRWDPSGLRLHKPDDCRGKYEGEQRSGSEKWEWLFNMPFVAITHLNPIILVFIDLLFRMYYLIQGPANYGPWAKSSPPPVL